MALTATIVITTIPNMATSTTFQVSGTYELNETTWTDELVYQDDGGTSVPIASPALMLGIASWSFTHPALPAGTHTVSVKDPYTGTVTVSNSFTVGVAQAITANAISGAVAGASFNFTGTLTNFTIAPTLTYSLNGGPAVTMTGVTASGWTTPVTIATPGNYTIIVSTSGITSNVVSFTVASVTTTHVITPNPPTPVLGSQIGVGQLVNFTGSLSGYTTAPSLAYSINGAPQVAMTGVTSTGWSMQFSAPSTAGTYNISVTDGTTSGLATFVVGAATPVITPLAPTNPTAGTSFTFTGVLSGYTTIPALNYSLNGGAPVTMTGVSITGWAMTVTIAVAGSYTLVVSDGTHTGSVSFTVSAANVVLRNWATNPGMDGSFWVQPFYSSANWIPVSDARTVALRAGTPSINLKGNFSVPWVNGGPNDPIVQVTDGTNTIHVRIPLGTIIETPTSQFDQSIGGTDSTQPYLVWSISGAIMNTGSVQASGSVITGTYGMAVQDGSGLIMVDAVTGAPGDNNSIGGIQDYELAQISANPNYVIQHMLAYSLDRSQIAPTGPIWPLLVIDTANPDTGPLPQGLTVGIPANVARPLGQTRGYYALWDQAQQFGLFFYNSGSVGGININVYDQSGAYAALVADLVASWPAVAANLQILNYASGTAGAQYSLATTKGFVTGATPAFPPPPPLNLAPTGGVNVAPSTFGAWYPSGYNAIPTNTTTAASFSITPNVPTGAIVNVAFTFSGSLAGYTSAPTLTYSLDGGTAQTLGGVTTTGWTTTLTVATSGAHTIVVTDAAHTVSGAVSFSVSSGTTTGTQVTWNPADLTAGITLSNNNYTATATGSATPGASLQGVRATTPINASQIVLWEVTFTAVTQDCTCGLANSSFALNALGGLGSDANGIGAYPSTGSGSQPAQTVYYANAQLTAGNGVASTAPVTVTMVVNGIDFYFSDSAMRTTAGVSFNNSTTANPITNTGGFSFSGIGATYFPVFNTLEGGCVAVLNDGTSPLSAFATAFLAANPSVVTLSGQKGTTTTKSIIPSTPNGVTAGSPFAFTGALSGYTTAPNLTYSINGATPVALAGVTATGWSTTLTIATTGTDTISVTDGTVTGTTASFTVSATGSSGTRVQAPLTGTVTTGTWTTLTTAAINTAPFAGSGQSGMQFSVLPPAQYNPNLLYSVLFVMHPDGDGMNGGVGGSSYKTGSNFLSGDAYNNGYSIDTLFNSTLFRTAYPAIVVAPQCWQPGSDTVDNFGGYGDTQNSGGNEQGLNLILQSIIAGQIPGIAASSVDPGRRYLFGYSLGAIGALASLVDNNQWNGPSGLNLWTAGIGESDQLFRPNGPANSTLFARMASVPYFAIWTTTDNNPSSYDIPAWQSYTGGGTSYPTENIYTASGVAACRAGTSQFYAINYDADSSAGAPTTTLMAMNSQGGNATALWNWLFSQSFTSSAPAITGVTFAPASTIIADSPVNTSAGQLTTTSSNGTLTGVSYSLTSTANFKVTSTGLVQFASATVAAGNYTLTGTVTAANASNSPQSFSFSITVKSSMATGVFLIQNGQVVAPNGRSWVGRGVALHDFDAPTWITNSACQPLTTLFPGINMVRLAAYSYWAPSTYAQQINWMTAQNIVVVIEDHTNSTGQDSGGGAGVVYTGAQLTSELNWYTSLATTFTSTYVWFGTDNEPSTSPSLAALYTWQQQTYSAIRVTGNQNIIEMEQATPNQQGTAGGVANPYTQMHNIVFGPHYYSWIWNGNGSIVVPQATMYSSAVGSTNSPYGGIVQQIANLQAFKSLDGVIPVGCFECGPSTTDTTVDASGFNCMAAIFQAVNAGNLFCFNAWAIDASAGDLLNNGTTSLTSWGSTVATQIALAAPAAPPQAAAVGFNTLTFGPNIIVGNTPDPVTSYPQFINGANWVPAAIYGEEWTNIQYTVNSDGSVTMNGIGQAFGDGLCTAAPGDGNLTTNPLVFTGTAFGGGGYFEAVMKGSNGGPMSFWMVDIETANGVHLGVGPNPWPGQAAGYGNWIERDIAEFDSVNLYGGALHNWYGIVGSNNNVTPYIGSDFTPSSSPDYTQYHKYGCLWVPATASSPGYTATFFDGVEVGVRYYWTLYNPALGPPPISTGGTNGNPPGNTPSTASNAGSVWDKLHMVLLLGADPGDAGGGTVTVQSVAVWQASASGNLIGAGP